MNRGYKVRTCDGQQIIITLQIYSPIGEPLPRVVLLLKTMPLNHSAHGTVKDQNAFCQPPAQIFINIAAIQ